MSGVDAPVSRRYVGRAYPYPSSSKRSSEFRIDELTGHGGITMDN